MKKRKILDPWRSPPDEPKPKTSLPRKVSEEATPHCVQMKGHGAGINIWFDHTPDDPVQAAQDRLCNLIKELYTSGCASILFAHGVGFKDNKLIIVKQANILPVEILVMALRDLQKRDTNAAKIISNKKIRPYLL
jgi:hypothetical protein